MKSIYNGILTRLFSRRKQIGRIAVNNQQLSRIIIVIDCSKFSDKDIKHYAIN